MTTFGTVEPLGPANAPDVLKLNLQVKFQHKYDRSGIFPPCVPVVFTLIDNLEHGLGRLVRKLRGRKGDLKDPVDAASTAHRAQPPPSA